MPCRNTNTPASKNNGVGIFVQKMSTSIPERYGRVDPSIIRDDRISSKGVESSHVNKIDEGGYQAAAIEFQRQLAQGRRNGAELSSSSRTSDIPSMTDFRDDELDWD